MKSVFSSILTLCLALALLMPMAAASGESGPSTSMLTDEESFRYALMQLNSYLSGSDRRDTTIQSVQRELDKVKNFDALGVPFLSYANALTAVEAGDFSRAQVYLTILESNSRLKDRLENEDFQRQYPNIRGVELLRRYTEGRQKEADGDSLKQQGRWPDARACWDEAMGIYLRCDGFNDSMDRYIQLAFV
ncbi:MAG: hypothetical protein IJU12_12715, partial [Clostridia bacterium]|nr:hypothetical protein [Clostridia bacterium]